METGERKTEEKPYLPKMPKAYSIGEVLAAGGATAFAEKMGKSLKGLEERLAALPPDAFLTDEELKDALDTLNASK
jgi:hypothetical protein